MEIQFSLTEGKQTFKKIRFRSARSDPYPSWLSEHQAGHVESSHVAVNKRSGRVSAQSSAIRVVGPVRGQGDGECVTLQQQQHISKSEEFVFLWTVFLRSDLTHA